MALTIKEIDKGIAFRLGDTIYLHKNLKNYPELRKVLLNHELLHTNGYAFNDFKLDSFGTDLSSVKKDYYKFMFTNKGAWKQLLPFLFIDGKIQIDYTLTILYFIGIILFIIVWSLIWKRIHGQ